MRKLFVLLITVPLYSNWSARYTQPLLKHMHRIQQVSCTYHFNQKTNTTHHNTTKALSYTGCVLKDQKRHNETAHQEHFGKTIRKMDARTRLSGTQPNTLQQFFMLYISKNPHGHKLITNDNDNQKEE